MKFFRGLMTFFLVLIILSGLGYIGYNVFIGDLFFSEPNMTSRVLSEAAKEEMNMSGTNNSATQNIALPNPLDAQNREKMNQAIRLIDQALELITIDPYSKATIPGSNDNMNMDNMQGNSSQGTGTINIYPSDNSSVNIVPSENETDAQDSTQANMGSMDMDSMDLDTKTSNNYVYDQGKLQQLHSGIYTMAQGILAINELNDDLLNQSMMIETSPTTYQTYVLRYGAALQNKTNLESAIELLNQVSVLINVNPYASPNGYAYNSDNLKQLHEGIFKLAQGMGMLNSLKEDFTNQMSQASIQAQNMISSSNSMDMVEDGLFGYDLFGDMSLSTIFKLIIIVLMIGLITGVLGAISKMFKNNNRNLKINRDYPHTDPREKE